MSDEPTKSELAASLLRTVNTASAVTGDIASVLVSGFKFGDDMNRMNTVYKDIIVRLNRTLATAQELMKISLKDGYSILKGAINDLPQTTKFVLDGAKDQLIQSAGGYPLTASMISQNSRLIEQENFIDLYSTLIFEMPKGYISEKVKRYYNKVILPYRFSPEMATHLWNKSKIKEQYWRDIMAENGIPKMEQELILDEIEQKPNVGTLLRMYQFITMSDSDIKYIMNENNITDPMIQALWIRYFHANRLRDEMMEYKQYLKRAFQSGQINATQLEAELQTFKASQEEIDAIVTTQEAEFQRTLLSTEQETRTWLYRKGLYGDPVTGEGAEEDFYDALAALNIDLALVNAIVRLEAAKKSIDWESQ